jgi:hypothetical protein
MRIVSPWKDRTAYVTIMLATLKESMRGHDDVVVTLYNNESQQPAPAIAWEFGEGCLFQDEIVSHDCHHVFIDMINREFAKCDDDFIVNLDSDCCVHP